MSRKTFVMNHDTVSFSLSLLQNSLLILSKQPHQALEVSHANTPHNKSNTHNTGPNITCLQTPRLRPHPPPQGRLPLHLLRRPIRNLQQRRHENRTLQQKVPPSTRPQGTSTNAPCNDSG